MSGSRTRVGLFLFFQALYALSSSGNAFRIPDEFEVYFQTEHLVDAGDISVPQTLEIRQPVIVNGQVVSTTSVFFGKVGLDGKPVRAVRSLRRGAGRSTSFDRPGGRRRARGGARAAAARAGVGDPGRRHYDADDGDGRGARGGGFHRAAIAIGTPERSALWLSLLLGGATVLWPYGTTFYTEAWQAAMLIWAAVFLIEARAGARPVAGVAIACVLIALTGLTKVTSLIFAPAFVVAVLCDRTVQSNRRWRVAIAISARDRKCRDDPPGMEQLSIRIAVRVRLRLDGDNSGRQSARVPADRHSARPCRSAVLARQVVISLGADAVAGAAAGAYVGCSAIAASPPVLAQRWSPGSSCLRRISFPKAGMRTVRAISCRSFRCSHSPLPDRQAAKWPPQGPDRVRRRRVCDRAAGDARVVPRRSIVAGRCERPDRAWILRAG